MSRDLSVTITPQWKVFLDSIEPGQFKRLRTGRIDHLILRAPDFYEMAKRAGIDVPYLPVAKQLDLNELSLKDQLLHGLGEWLAK